jgi:hypothetical protein
MMKFGRVTIHFHPFFLARVLSMSSCGGDTSGRFQFQTVLWPHPRLAHLYKVEVPARVPRRVFLPWVGTQLVASQVGAVV